MSALKAEALMREFQYNRIRIPDPNSLSAEQVRDSLIANYPEIATASEPRSEAQVACCTTPSTRSGNTNRTESTEKRCNHEEIRYKIANFNKFLKILTEFPPRHDRPIIYLSPMRDAARRRSRGDPAAHADHPMKPGIAR